MDWLTDFHKRYLLFLLLILPVFRAGLLPDELLTDDAEILEREKRDGFFERLFKTFPLFKHDEEKKEDDDDDDDVSKPIETNTIELDIPDFAMPTFDETFFNNFSSSSDQQVEPSLSTSVSSSSLLISPTLKLQTSIVSIISLLTNTPVLTMTPTLIVSATRNTNVTPSSSIASTLMTRTSVPMSSIVGSSILNTIQPTASSHTSVPQATVASTLSQVSIQPTPSERSGMVSSTEKKAVFDFDFVLTAPHLPDEKGYGNVLAQQQPKHEDREVKTFNFFFSKLFIPILTGVALCLSLAIMTIKCIRKRRIRKTNYYGGKPESRLYGLDHMGLLSDMSSDEEYEE